MSTLTSSALSKKQIHQFHDEGYLGPLTGFTSGEMAALRARIEREVLTTTGPNPALVTHSRHLDHRVVYDMCSHPALVEAVVSIYGPDIVLWSSNFWIKEPRTGKEVPWHQDINYWPLDPPINITAWIALDEVTTENSCVRIIPGSHKNALPHLPTAGKFLGEEVDPNFIDESRAVDMELRPGEFFLFSERLLHHSFPNTSDKRRMGLSVRMTLPCVKVYHEQSPPLFSGHANVMLCGEDRFGLNRLTAPPD
jgi:hypothetical protein